MSLWTAYGDTPVSEDDQQALTDYARGLLSWPILKDEVQYLEQGIQDKETADYLMPAVLDRRLTVDDLLADTFPCELHGRLYGDLWTWAGKYRNRTVSIGVWAEQIRCEMRAAMDTVRWQVEAGSWTPQVLGIAVHAHVVRIHPFVDGNGRTSRLMGDLVFLAAQGADMISAYDWLRPGFEKERYVGLLQAFDKHQDPHDLARYIGVRPYGG